MKITCSSFTIPSAIWRQKGFTLLELMVAMSIFAIVSLLTMGGLSSVLDTQAHTEKNMQRLIRFQMTFTIMSRELQQLSNRSIRDEYGAAIDSISNVTSEGIDGIEFTHHGRFTLGDTVSLQRVAYYLEDKQLVKKVWRVLDRVEDSKAVKQIILEDINEFNVSFYSVKQSESRVNQEVNGEISWQESIVDDAQLRAIKITLISDDYDELYRVFEVAH